MANSVSPYALLCASKPKPTPTLVTPYDLYSAAQNLPAVSQPQEAQRHDSTPQRLAATIPKPPTYTDIPSAPMKKTHYIHDIHARHNQALSQSVRAYRL